MKKHIAIVMLLSLFVYGCDDSSSSNGDDRISLEMIVTVNGINARGIYGYESRSFMTEENKRIMILDSTRVLVQRSSCSGLEASSSSRIDLGSILAVKYYPTDIRFDGTTQIIDAIKVEAYNPDCL